MLQRDPENETARRVAKVAQSELTHAAAFLDMTVASTGGDAPEVAQLAAFIPKDSATYTRAQELLAKPVVGKRVLGQSSGGPVTDVVGVGAEGHQDEVGALLAKKASQPSEGDHSGSKPLEGRPSAKTYIEAVAAAKEAARMGNWSLAGIKAKEALRNSPGDPDALSVLGIAACNLGDRGTAERAIAQMKGSRQTMVKQICASKGVPIE